MRGAGPAPARGERPPADSPVRQLSLYPPPRSTRHTARRRRSVVLAVAVVVVLGAGLGAVLWALRGTAAGDSTVPESYAGTWRGEMSQVDDNGDHVTDWGAEIKLEQGEERGVSEWYTFDCRGSLSLSERDGGRLVFDYVETYDPDERCVDESRLVLTSGDAAGTLSAEWTAVSHSGVTMTSTGTLR
ncbi:hypothetical protein KUM37_05330 [Streptomonospora sp. NEAU-YY374]|nr:hypothetical protein [Streptomonospora nanhaiensis]MBX9388749.1 hypothetical protein [Streptomonospora nanhaiensis]